MECTQLVGLAWLMAHGEKVRDGSSTEYQPDGKLRTYGGIIDHVCVSPDGGDGDEPQTVREVH